MKRASRACRWSANRRRGGSHLGDLQTREPQGVSRRDFFAFSDYVTKSNMRTIRWRAQALRPALISVQNQRAEDDDVERRPAPDDPERPKGRACDGPVSAADPDSGCRPTGSRVRGACPLRPQAEESALIRRPLT